MPKVLVAGSTGVVGFAALRQFASLPGWEAVGFARRPRPVPGAEVIAVDLADREATRAALAAQSDVTHVVYAALFEKPGLMPGWFEHDQMERNRLMFVNLLDSVMEHAPALQHVTVLQGTKAYGAHVEPMKLPGREREPRHQHENFYWLQEDALRERQSGAPWSFTIWRPQIIFGEAFGSNMNAIPALGVYANLMRLDGQPLHFPGGAPFLTEAVDADLLARAISWAATAPAARNETFNITNGDVFVAENLWPAIADAFGMAVGERRPLSLTEEMPKRQADWTALHQRFALQCPVSLDDFVGQSFIYADLIMGYGATEPGNPTMLSTIKLRQAGFGECVDTEDMFRRMIATLQDERRLPPRGW